MTAYTAQSLIDQALKIGGIFTEDIVVSATQYAEALLMLNQMLEGWGQDALTSPFLSRWSFSLVNGQERYDLNVVAPSIQVNTVILAFAWNNNNGEGIPLKQLEAEEYFQNKARTYYGSMPVTFHYHAFLDAFLYWPVPVFTAPNTASASVFYLTTPYKWSSLAASQDLPDGWSLAIAYDLWVHLAPIYSMAPTEAQVTRAKDLKMAIANTNKTNTVGNG